MTTGLTFDGRVVRFRVQDGKRSFEIFYLLMADEDVEAAADHQALDHYDFVDQPKNGPAVVYRRELDTSSRAGLSLGENNWSSVMGRATEPDPGPHGRKYLGEQLLTSYDTEYIEMVWGFTDQVWDGPRDEWFAARVIARLERAVFELVVLVNEATWETAESSVLKHLASLGYEAISEVEVERTYLIRPGRRTPPIFYIEPARVPSQARK